MLKRLGTTVIGLISGVVLLATPAHTYDGESNVAAAPSTAEALEDKCFLAFSPQRPRLFGMEFDDGGVFRVTFCGPEGTYNESAEFLVFSFWQAEVCDSGAGPIVFDGAAIASAVLLYRAEGQGLNTRGFAVRFPCNLIP